MTKQADARAYLVVALERVPVDMATASRAVGKNHAYFQQYISGRKPGWLPESVREALTHIYGIDGAPLKQPRSAPVPRNKGGAAPQVDPPDSGKGAKDSDLLELLQIWSLLQPEMRALGLQILRNLAQTRKDAG